MQTIKIQFKKQNIEIKKINVLYYVATGKLGLELTKHIEKTFKGKELHPEDMDLLELYKDMIKFLESIIIKPKNFLETLDLADISNLFNLILVRLIGVNKEEIEQLKKS